MTHELEQATKTLKKALQEIYLIAIQTETKSESQEIAILFLAWLGFNQAEMQQAIENSELAALFN